VNFSIPWFVPNKPLLPGQLFEGKVGAYQSGALTQDKTLKLKKVFRLFKLDSWPFLLEFNSFPMVPKVWSYVGCPCTVVGKIVRRKKTFILGNS
jgi:hypothetical protein